VFNRTLDNAQLSVCVYVDDLLLTCVSTKALGTALEELKSKFREVKSSSGEDVDYVSLEINFSSDREVTVAMSKYTTECLSEWDGNGSAPTPTRYDIFADDDSAPLIEAKREEFHHRVAKLLYLAKRVRPDILLPISVLVLL